MLLVGTSQLNPADPNSPKFWVQTSAADRSEFSMQVDWCIRSQVIFKTLINAKTIFFYREEDRDAFMLRWSE